MYAIFVQLALYDRVIVPEYKCVVIRLVLYDAELGIHVILHLIVVTVQMVGSYVHEHGDVGMELIHVVELEAA